MEKEIYKAGARSIEDGHQVPIMGVQTDNPAYVNGEIVKLYLSAARRQVSERDILSAIKEAGGVKAKDLDSFLALLEPLLHVEAGFLNRLSLTLDKKGLSLSKVPELGVENQVIMPHTA